MLAAFFMIWGTSRRKKTTVAPDTSSDVVLSQVEASGRLSCGGSGVLSLPAVSTTGSSLAEARCADPESLLCLCPGSNSDRQTAILRSTFCPCLCSGCPKKPLENTLLLFKGVGELETVTLKVDAPDEDLCRDQWPCNTDDLKLANILW